MSSRLRTRLRAGTGLSTPSLSLEFQTATGALDPRITFSRTSQATLVDSTGKLTYAPNNLVTNSEDFESANWTKGATTVSSNSTAAPNGTTTADTVQATSGTASKWIGATATVASSTSHFLSFYAKAGTHNFIQITNSGDADAFANFNLSSGVVGTAGAKTTASIQSIGNGWYRCIALFSPTVTYQTGHRCYLVPSASATYAQPLAATGSETVFLWGAQLEQVTYQTTPGAYNSTSPKNLLGYTQEFDNAAWTKSNAFVQTNLLTNSEAFDNANWNKVNATIGTNADAAPTGVMSADGLIEDTTNGSHAVQQFFTFANATAYTLSVYVKAGTRSWVQVLLPSAAFGASTGGFFNLSGAGSLGVATGSPTARTITNVGGGWYRLTVTATSTAATGGNIPIVAAAADNNSFYAGVNGATALFLWGAQLVQGSTAGDYQRTDAAAAAVQYTAPDGSRTADKLVEDTATAAHRTWQAPTTAAAAHTFSVYLKAAERSFALIYAGVTNVGVMVNLLTGATNTVAGITAPTSSSVTDAGNGWYRCSMTFTTTAAASSVFVYLANNSTSFSYAGDGTSGVLLWGAQLSNSASLDPYVYNPVAAPTSAAYYGPRFDYDPVTLANKGLLIEEQRTNLVTYSQEFGSWTNSGATITANTLLAPDGTTTADTVARTTSTSDHVYNALSFTGDAVKAVSVWIKKGTSPAALIALLDVTASLYRLWVDVTWSGTTPSLAFTNGSLISSTNYGNGWWRLELATTSVTAANTNRLYVYPGRTGSVNGDNIYCWGAQAENATFATSYIPTVASQVTRTADVALMQGANFSNWYNVNQGTFTVDFTPDLTRASPTRIINVGQGAAAGRVVDINSDGTNWLSYNGTTNLTLGPSAVTSATQKIATVYAAGDYAGTLNGATPATLNSALLNVATRMSIGSYDGTLGFLNGHIRRIGYYPTRLANAQLQSLTAQSTIPSLSLDFTTQVFNVG